MTFFPLFTIREKIGIPYPNNEKFQIPLSQKFLVFHRWRHGIKIAAWNWSVKWNCKCKDITSSFTSKAFTNVFRKRRSPARPHTFIVEVEVYPPLLCHTPPLLRLLAAARTSRPLHLHRPSAPPTHQVDRPLYPSCQPTVDIIWRPEVFRRE